MNITFTTVYDLDSLIESFDQSIRRMEEMAKEYPAMEDWCQGYANACAEAMIRIKNHVLNIGKTAGASLYGKNDREVEA